MGRPERPIDPSAGPLQHFAHELRVLRRAAGGLSYREMARQAHYSRTALSQAASGEELPSLTVTLAYVAACGGDPVEWEARWHTVEAELAAERATAEPADEGWADSPYRGLAAYQTADADRFFGRAQLVEELLARLTDGSFLAVFGASGSGKSSLLRAGLIPAVQAGRLPGSRDWPVVLLTPGEHPLAELAAHVAAVQRVPPGALLAELRADPDGFAVAIRQALVGKPESGRLLLVVDQFEEIFTLCTDEDERARFVRALLSAVPATAPRLCLVLGIRADFYARCADYPELVDALHDAQLLVGAMTEEQLRSVITEPAAGAGLTVESALVATMLADARGGNAVLPLLSHALLETWKRRRGNRLTVAGYRAAGGTHGAIAQTAQAVYDRLSSAEQQIAQGIFLRLAALGEGTEDTRRRVRRDELAAGRDAAVDGVLQRLAAARLVTLDDDSVEVAHEAIIREWPLLRDWLAADRDGLRTHRQLTEAAQTWQSLDRDPGALYRGVRLAAARQWATTQGARLNDLEREFLARSGAQEQDELHATRQRNRRLRVLTAVLAVLLLVAGVTSAVALGQWQLAQDQRDLATARQLAAEAEAVTSRDPQLATLLSLVAANVTDTAETRSALLNQLHRVDRVEKFLTGHTVAANGVAFSPDGTVLASGGGDGKVIVWDAATREARFSLDGQRSAVNAVAFSPDGHLLASGDQDGSVIVWDLAQRAARSVLAGHARAVNGVAFSPDGRTLASAGDDGATVLWDVSSGAPRARLAGHTSEVRAVAFGVDGRVLATGGTDSSIILWDPATGAERARLSGHAEGVRALAFSPDGATLTSASFDGAVVMWDLAARTPRAHLVRHTDAVRSVAFSPDGRTLATGSSDRTIVLWDVATATPRATMTGHRDEVTGVAFRPDGRGLASASLDDQVVLWDTTRESLTRHDDSVFAVAFGPDGRTLASVGKDRTAILWDVAGRTPLATLPLGGWGLDVAVSPDGRTVASGGLDGAVTLWEPGQVGAPAARLTGHPDWVLGVAFSPDGRLLASAGYDSNDDGDGAVVLWDAVQRVPVATLTDPHVAVGATEVAFSADGRLLAVGSKDASIELWDLATRSPIGTLTGHTAAIRSVAFAPDGRTLASGSKDGAVLLWDVASRSQRATLRGHTDEAYDVAFSPDGRLLASAGFDRRAIVWDVAARTQVASLTAHTEAVNGVAFSPDGRLLATSSDDKTIILWNPDVTAARQRLCDMLGRDLTDEEWTTYLGDRPRRPACG